jgi:uncharacterized membrane protein (DUF4010 family)
LASLGGAVSYIVGGETLLAISTAGVFVLLGVAYFRGHGSDPGLTTQIALILTIFLGGLSMQRPALAGGLAVTVAVHWPRALRSIVSSGSRLQKMNLTTL